MHVVSRLCSHAGILQGAAAEAIRNTMREEVHVSCSCGIGSNRVPAKVASDKRRAAYLPCLVTNSNCVLLMTSYPALHLQVRQWLKLSGKGCGMRCM